MAFFSRKKTGGKVVVVFLGRTWRVGFEESVEVPGTHADGLTYFRSLSDHLVEDASLPTGYTQVGTVDPFPALLTTT